MLCSAAVVLGASQSRSALAASVLDLHKVDWANATLPGAVCGAPHPIHLHQNKGFVSPIPHRFSHDDFYSQRGVDVGSGPVVYGDLAGNHHDNAGLQVVCTNGGGTADGQLLWSWVIFSGRGARLSVLAVVFPRVQLPKEMPTLLQIAMRPGKLTAHEYFYGPYDGTCCSTGRATTIWTYTHGTLVPGVPVITKEPRASPMFAHHRATRFIADTDWVFTTSRGTPHSQRNINRRGLQRAAEIAGLGRDGWPPLRFHDLRHTFASHLILDLGLDVAQVSRILGHASITVTLDVYTHLFDEARHTREIRTLMASSEFAACLTAGRKSPSGRVCSLNGHAA